MKKRDLVRLKRNLTYGAKYGSIYFYKDSEFQGVAVIMKVDLEDNTFKTNKNDYWFTPEMVDLQEGKFLYPRWMMSLNKFMNINLVYGMIIGLVLTVIIRSIFKI